MDQELSLNRRISQEFIEHIGSLLLNTARYCKADLALCIAVLDKMVNEQNTTGQVQLFIEILKVIQD